MRSTPVTLTVHGAESLTESREQINYVTPGVFKVHVELTYLPKTPQAVWMYHSYFS